MAAVTADQLTKMKNHGSLNTGPIKASKTLYDLTMCFIDAADGYVTDDDNAGANKLAGINCNGKKDNSAGASGDLDAEFYEEGHFLLTGSGFTLADVGKKIYAEDNFTVNLTASTRTYIGTVSGFVSATQVWVKIDTQLP